MDVEIPSDWRRLELRDVELPRRRSLYADDVVVGDPGMFLAAQRIGAWIDQAACRRSGFGGSLELFIVLDTRSGDAHLCQTSGAKLWCGIKLVPGDRVHPGFGVRVLPGRGK